MSSVKTCEALATEVLALETDDAIESVAAAMAARHSGPISEVEEGEERSA